MYRLVVVLAAGCGRLGFDGAAGDAAHVDASPIDVIDAPPIDAPSGAVSTTFGESPTAANRNVTADTYLNGSGNDMANNYGGSNELRVRDDEHMLIRFDVAVIPPAATIVSAELRLVANAVAAAATVDVHEVLEEWVENSLDGQVGSSSWLRRADGVAWMNAGAAPPMSAGPKVTSLAVMDAGPHTFTTPAATVQAWITAPATNKGFVLLNASGNRVRYASKESGEIARPLLTVVYVP